MKNDIRKSPPHWCKNAIPSAKGWCHPKTGELLIAVKGLAFDVVEHVKEVVVEKVTIEVDLPKEEVGVETPKKRGGRKKKTETTEK